MAILHVSDLSPTALDNKDIGGTDYSKEESLMKWVNDVDRFTVKLMADWYDDLGGTQTVGGTADAITVTGDVQTLAAGQVLVFIASADNTGATTLNWNGKGVKDVKKVSGGSVVALAAGDILNAEYTGVTYDGTQFILQNPATLFLQATNNLSDLVAIATARTNLGLALPSSTRTILKALDTTKQTIAYLTETGREGSFIWTTGDYSTEVTADTQEGIYLKADAIATTSGAWIRVYTELSVLYFGAKGDESTDDATAINAAIANAGNQPVYLPPGNYRVASTVVLNALDTLMGYPGCEDGTTIIADLALAKVISMDGGAGSQITNLRNLRITRAAGSIPAASVGLNIGGTTTSGDAQVQNCVFDRHGTGTKLDNGLGITFNRCTWSSCSASFVDLDSVEEPQFNDCRFGRNGVTTGPAATSAFIFRTNCDTVKIDGCVFADATSGTNVVNIFEFINYTNVNGIFYITNCHGEKYDNILTSVGTSSIKRIIMSGCTFNGASPSRLITQAVAGDFNRLNINNSMFGGSQITAFDSHTDLIFNGNYIANNWSVNAGVNTIVGNAMNGTLTLSGAMVATTVVSNVSDNAAVIVSTATGDIYFSANVGTTGNAVAQALARASLGFSDPIFDKAAPGNIGATTPGTGKFTTLNTTNKITVTASDQSTVRLKLVNSGASGETFDIVGGNPGISNIGFSIYDVTDASTRLHCDTTGHWLPGVTEAQNLGSAAKEWDNIYLQNAATVSDLRRKNVQGEIINAIGFLTAVDAVTFTFKDMVIPAWVAKNLNEDGDTVETIMPEQIITHSRPHTGVIAQQVKEAMTASGMKDWAGYAYDEETDTHLIRPMEFIAFLIRGVQELDSRINELEGR